MKTKQDILDRAAEWIGVNHPEADGAEYERLLAETCAELETLDRAADAAEQMRHTCKDPGSRWYHRCEVCDAAEHAA
jgi:hypothetical protein